MAEYTGNMTFDEWEEKYKPIKNPFTGDIFFETIEDEFAIVAKSNPLTVWTDMDCDGYNYIMSGKHFVNRMGYYITEVPYKEGEMDIIIILSTPDDEEPEDENE